MSYVSRDFHTIAPFLQLSVVIFYFFFTDVGAKVNSLRHFTKVKRGSKQLFISNFMSLALVKYTSEQNLSLSKLKIGVVFAREFGFRLTHVLKIGAGFRSRVSSALR